MTTPTENQTIDAFEWMQRELDFAEDAHELTPELREAVAQTIDGNQSVETYSKAAQLIACYRNTCGDHRTHDHRTLDGRNTAMTTTPSLHFEANENTSDVLRSVFAELNDYYSKPVRTLLEIVGWETPDLAGDLTGGRTQKRLRMLTPVRVLIDPDAEPARVVELLRSIIEWYAADGPSIGGGPDGPDPF